MATLGVSASSSADPQLSTGMTLGIAGNRRPWWSESQTSFVGGLRGELLLGRTRDNTMGVGPFVEILTTTGFSDFQVGGGASVLLPVHPYFPVVVSVGAFDGPSGGAWRPGVSWEVFWGIHAYNYNSPYSLSFGFFVGGRLWVTRDGGSDVLAGLRLDLELFAMPVFLALGARPH